MKIIFRKILRLLGVKIPMQSIKKDIKALEPKFLEHPMSSKVNSSVANTFGLMLFPEPDTVTEGIFGCYYETGGWRPKALSGPPMARTVVNNVSQFVKNFHILPG